MQENGCCDDNTPTVVNPKEELRGRRRGRKHAALFDIKNPIPEEIRDADELGKMFEKYRLVPYAGSDKHTGQSLLYWYLMLAKLSPTHGAAIEKLSKYTVGGRGIFVRSENPDYDIGEEMQPLTRAEKEAYEAAITQFIDFQGGVRDFHRRLVWSYKAHGNAWVEMSVATRNGQRRVHLRTVRQANAMYMRTEPDEMQIVAISPIWTEAYLRKNPPRMLPLYPNFTVDDGVQKTLFHLKNGDNNWYGRPDSASADLYKYREVQDALYIVTQAANNFTGQLIIEAEDDGGDSLVDETGAVNSGFDSFADRMMENFTNQGENPISIVVTSRPMGARPMFVFQVQPNTNQAWYKETGAMSENFILGAHGCTLRFMGKDAANGFSQDAFVSDYVMNMEPTINDLRTTIMVFSNRILSVAWEALAMPELNLISLSFQSPIQRQIDEYKGRQNTPQPQGPTVNLNTDQPTR